MPDKIIDFRSDTVTRPTDQMRAAIAQADVGDDVFGDDPVVKRLQSRTAEMLDKEAAIFMPSGTMTNQIAIRIHCKPGDEFLCETACHIYNFEQGAAAQLSGVVARTLPGRNGLLEPKQFEGLVRREDIHQVRTKLVCLENTHNYGGGRVLPYDDVAEICRWAHENHLKTHLDGARLFNAVVASGIDASRWCEHFDTVSVCFSKGLGAPVGSALAGTREMIEEARRHRKAFGGGMRQAGIIAAGALFALENHVDRLKNDHENAQILSESIRRSNGLTLTHEQVDTNIVFFQVGQPWSDAKELVTALAERGVWMAASKSHIVRAVTHLDVSDSDVAAAGKILQELSNH